MKITRRQLRRIIKEEMSRVLQEDSRLGLERLAPDAACPDKRCHPKRTDVVGYMNFNDTHGSAGQVAFFVPHLEDEQYSDHPSYGQEAASPAQGYMARVKARTGDRYDVWRHENPELYQWHVDSAIGCGSSLLDYDECMDMIRRRRSGGLGLPME